MVDGCKSKADVTAEHADKQTFTFRAVGKQSTILFNSMLDAFVYCKIVVDKKGKPVDWIFLDVNSAYEQMAGLKKEKIVGKNVKDLYPEEQKDPANWIYRYGTVALTRKPARFENYSQSLKKWLNVSSYSPKKGYFIAIFEDIGEGKKAEEALKESEEKFRNLAEESPNMIFINQGGRIVYANKKCEENMEYTRTEFYSPGFSFLSLCAPEDVEVLRSAFTRHMKGEVVSPYEYVLITRQGKRIDAIITSKLIEFEGEKSILGIVTDITERKKAEQELLHPKENLEKLVEERTEVIRKSEQRYRELYESFDEAFIATDWELNVIHWNKAAERITRVEVKNALGKKIYDVLPEMASVDITPYYQALQEKRPTRFMMNTVSRETGREAIFEISTYPSSLGIVIIVEDKTELEQIKRLSAIGQVAGMVGHDIRNPLQAITSDLYLARTEMALIPENKEKKNTLESLLQIEKNIDYISKIVSDLQDFSRPLKPNMENVDLKLLFEILFAKNDFPENVEISFEVETDARRILSDSSFIHRAMNNLVNNAIQAMPNGGKLTIHAHKEATDIVIAVSDTGVGIPEAVKSKLFTPMFTTKAKGQGFGLVVIKRMTEALGGTLSFESEVGRGTTFIVRLPQKK